MSDNLNSKYDLSNKILNILDKRIFTDIDNIGTLSKIDELCHKVLGEMPRGGLISTGDMVNIFSNADRDVLYGSNRIGFKCVTQCSFMDKVIFLYFGTLVDTDNCEFKISATNFNWEWRQIVVSVDID